MVSETTKEGRMSKLRQPTCSRVEVGKRYKVISHLGLKLTQLLTYRLKYIDCAILFLCQVS